MTNKEMKLDLIQALYNREDSFVRQVGNHEYLTRCPHCGDSKNLNHGHLYIKINPDDNFPVVYNCIREDDFGGILTEDILEMLEIYDVNLKSGLSTLNKTADKFDKKNLSGGIEFKTFDYHTPEITIGPKTEYIENRVGLKFSMEDFEKMKVITSLSDFLNENHLKNTTVSNYVAHALEKYYVGFLTFGNSHILFRDITEKCKIRWFKYPITEESRNNRIFYSMQTEINPLTTEPLIINLSEGVMDTISICYNLSYDKKNIMNFTVSGKYYYALVMQLIDMGIVGSNVTINIFSDNDAMFNKKSGKDAIKSTTLEYYEKVFCNLKYAFKEVNVYYNMKSKDYGVPRDEILVTKKRL